MTDRTEIATRLVLQKAVLDLLKDADAETRDVAKVDYTPGAADPVELDGVSLGRVRMDKPRKSVTVMDWAALDRWVREHIPEGIIVRESINPALVTALCKANGVWTDPATGEDIEVPGIYVSESAPSLVVTTTDAAEEWARRTMTGALGYSLRGEIEQ